MGLDDLAKKAGDALHSDQVEKASDQLLGKAKDTAKKVTGGKFDEQIDKAAEKADKAIGTE
ncbi:MAG: antitoxin [Propionibacteriaceae bacterium]|jgi:hypothetical protein|uniref:Antitoxin n=2 Tax=Propionibacterium TaxID=1743 RepID=A0A383S9Z2_9ACTN|nr:MULTISPECIES: Rv0909 family putative TA system antitoxin [Propionibacterium]MBE6477682.1 antitoxin [Propionibacteriaceae bacterium]RLP06087.1 antitoxin [Propionibacterium australiense]RLP06323.1 antitoxin [Propionibacterium australiense]SPF68241.1 MT0933-like antitoxin protein [Propionibacterium ruminifibrarum]SYZ34623.1 MT0933-like antitoxin protein [Propionibacterium australiense]